MTASALPARKTRLGGLAGSSHITRGARVVGLAVGEAPCIGTLGQAAYLRLYRIAHCGKSTVDKSHGEPEAIRVHGSARAVPPGALAVVLVGYWVYTRPE